MTMRSRTLFPALLLTLAGIAAPAIAADTPAAPGGQPTSEAQASLLAMSPGVQIHPNGPGLLTVYGPAFSHGRSPQDSANNFILNHVDAFGAVYADLTARGLNSDGSHLVPVSYEPASDTYRFTLVNYSQVRDGLPVWRSDLRLLVRNETDFPLVLAKSALKNLGAFRASNDLRDKAISEAAANNSALEIFPALTAFEPARMVIFAGSPDVPAAPILAWEFVGTAPPDATGVPQRWLFIVDAVSGVAVYRESLINHVNITGNVSGWATSTTRAGACDPASVQPLPYARVAVTGGNVAFADVNGNFNITHGGAAPVTVTSSPRGQFFRVYNAAATTSELSEVVTPPGPVNFLHNPGVSTEGTLAEVDAYIEANVVRDFTLAFNPSFPAVATSSEFRINVNLNETCNAYYDGSSINFFLAGGGCNNTAFSTVVYHEYGHHLVQSAGSGQGAYGEGYGDVVGVIITDESLLGRGFQSCSSGLRNANNTCQYSATECSSCGDAIHSCGRLLSGCVWSVRTNLLASNPAQYRQLISDMAVNSVLLHQGTSIAHDIVIDFLTLNDNDADITNGSPNYVQIANGFQAHGLNAPPLPPLAFSFLSGRPQFVSPAGGDTLTVEVSGITATPQLGTGDFVYDNGSGWVTVPMTQIDQNVYTIAFPATPCGETIRYYVTARTSTNVTIVNPTDAPASYHTSVAATGTESVFADDFEINRGWTIGAPGDAATAGIWVRVNPNGAFVGGIQSQPDDDVTPSPGTLCFVTGNAGVGVTAGSQDIDGGATTITSPVFDLSAAVAPTIGYWRWYSNHAGAEPYADTFDISISNDGGSNWTAAEVVGPAGPQTEGAWYFHQFNVADVIAQTSSMRMRFVASDLGNGSLVEAGLDEFAVTTFLCDSPCQADFDQSGMVDVPDIFAFLTAWFALDTSADIDGVAGVAVPDIFFFLSLWFTGCP